MKSRRPPLNLTEPKLRSATRAAPDSTPEAVADKTASEAAISGSMSAEDLLAPSAHSDSQGEKPELVTPDIDDTSDNDILNAPLNAPAHVIATHVEPVRTSERQGAPAGSTDAKAAPLAEAMSLDVPDAIARMTPPPKPTPPAPVENQHPAKASRDLKTLKVEPEGILKAAGMSPFFFWGTATVISLFWACGLTAFALGAQSDLTAFAFAPFKLAVLVFLALFPIGLIFASAFALRNAAALARQAQRTAALADALLAPAAAAAHETGELVDVLRAQVDHAVKAVRLAHADITELSAGLKAETDRLQDAANIARASTQHITRALSHEREAITAMGQALDSQSAHIIEAVDRQARMVADASDLAQTQLREAEASLASSASSLMSAAADVSDTARTASEDLDRQTVRLETAGAGVADQVRSVEEGLSQQRAGLVSAALSLRADQEDFAVHIENQRAQLTEALSITRVATVDLGETSARGIDVLRDIVVSAQEQFRHINDAADHERTAFETRVHATLSNISVMAADARDDLIDETRRSLEQLNIAATEARRAADQAAQTAQGRVDRLNETIFEASKKADEVFDTRFSAARRLIEDSADLINEAGDKTAERLDESFAHTRQTIAEVNAALNELNQSAEHMPLVAQERLNEIRKSVEDGVAAMTAAAQKAALETEAIDQAFQERVKRNYDMLTEAVRLMGVISGDTPMHGQAAAAVTPPPAADPSVERFRERDYGRAVSQPRRTESPVAQTPAPVPVPQPAPGSRLRLSPLSSETRPSTGPAPRQNPQPVAQQPKTPGSDGWSWRDLLNGMEGREAQPASVSAQAPTSVQPIHNLVPQAAGSVLQPPQDPEFDNLDVLIINEIAAMGVDAAALLSRSRLDETISAIMAEDNEGARLVVRRVAPAAIRRLSRRLLSDAVLRQQAHDFASFYDQQINIALMSKNVSQAMHEVLSSDSGRAYLLFDAALSDLI